jgi:flagella basal body P-ring formation protein FlgA
MRIAVSLLVLMLAGPVFAAQPVALRAAPTDGDGVITLGDLFEGAGEASSVVIAPGSKDGGAVVLEAARVQAAARAAGLSWPNASGLRRIAVRSGADGPAARKGATEALVYVRSLRAGEVITAEDVAWAPVASAPADAPEDADAVIGLAAKKPLRAGSAVGARDLHAALVIRKDEMVLVRFRAGGVSLSLQGKALGPAAEGQPVRVLNLQSKSVIEAIAAGPGVAVVGREAEALKTPRLAQR